MVDVELVIKIPETFGMDVDDKFQGFFKRLRFEITRHLITNTSLVCGAYELETIDILMEAFEQMKIIPDNATNTGNNFIKTVTNAKEAENYPISEDISKDIEEINKLIFENGQTESEVEE